MTRIDPSTGSRDGHRTARRLTRRPHCRRRGGLGRRRGRNDRADRRLHHRRHRHVRGRERSRAPSRPTATACGSACRRLRPRIAGERCGSCRRQGSPRSTPPAPMPPGPPPRSSRPCTTASSRYRRAGGAAGLTVVAGLASTVPVPTDDGRTYTFRLRDGHPILRRQGGHTPGRRNDVRADLHDGQRMGSIAAAGAGRRIVVHRAGTRGVRPVSRGDRRRERPHGHVPTRSGLPGLPHHPRERQLCDPAGGHPPRRSRSPSPARART